MREFLHPVLFGLLLVAIAVIAHVGLRRVRKRLEEARGGTSPADPPEA